MSARPKKAAPEKAVVKAAPEAAPPSPPPEGAAAVDGADRARLNRLAAAGWEVDRCSVLGAKLDVGPRANRWLTPRRTPSGKVVAEIIVAIVESGLEPERLRLAAVAIEAARSKP